MVIDSPVLIVCVILGFGMILAESFPLIISLSFSPNKPSRECEDVRKCDCDSNILCSFVHTNEK